ncbi:Uncharacterized protein PECH_002335 [Penicillium ucsense]|uniref:F-box domain-containing protein n=1 Tax=Penicillium ucsense TaxID=2839758 RepID=A0A8J8VX22_9EURO|nr:Uncharacterized protein PECM_001906 [Penicillium ucsense]KAF7731040.1 Uncharacterized protein PECH_002335 [Penicillium ucsense]
MLLRLPTELIELIFRNCDPCTFFNLAYCSRYLYTMSILSREMVKHQFRELPGWPHEKLEQQARDNFPYLVSHLNWTWHHHLYGARYFTDRKLFEFEGKKLNPRACCLEPRMPATALLAFHGDETLYLVDIHEGDIRVTRRLESPAQKYGTIEVLHTSLNSSGVWALHRFKPFTDQNLDMSHPFVKQAAEAYPEGCVYLAFYALNGNTDAVRLYGFPDESEYDPIALATYWDEKFAISWQHRQRAGDHHVLLYLTDVFDEDEDGDEDTTDDSTDEDEESEDEDMEDDEDEESEDTESDDDQLSSSSDGHPGEYRLEDYMEENLTEVSETRPTLIRSIYHAYSLTNLDSSRHSHQSLIDRGPSTKLAFNDRGFQLLHFSRGRTLFSYFQKLSNIMSHPEPNVHDNSCVVKYSPELALSFAIGIPFWGLHSTNDDSNIPGTCHWQYLAVGIATHRVEHWTVACLLTSESNPREWHCTHEMNLERGRRFDDWRVVAQLGGFHESDTTQGSLVVPSPRCSRLAMASWKTITVWPVSPHALVNPNSVYYHPWTNTAGMTELRSESIELDAVILQMKFSDENEIVALTDRGLMILNIWPSGKGTLTIERRQIP